MPEESRFRIFSSGRVFFNSGLKRESRQAAGEGRWCEDEKRLLFRKISRCNGTHRRDIICADAGEDPSFLKEGRRWCGWRLLNLLQQNR